MDRGKNQSADLMRDATGTLVPRFAWPRQKELIESDPQLAGIYAKCVRDVRWIRGADVSVKDGFLLIATSLCGIVIIAVLLDTFVGRSSVLRGLLFFVVFWVPWAWLWHPAQVRFATRQSLLRYGRCASCTASLATPASPGAAMVSCSRCSAQWNAGEVSPSVRDARVGPHPDQLLAVGLPSLHNGVPYVADATCIARPMHDFGAHRANAGVTPEESSILREFCVKTRWMIVMSWLGKLIAAIGVLTLLILISLFGSTSRNTAPDFTFDFWLIVALLGLGGIVFAAHVILILRGRHTACVEPTCKQLVRRGHCPSCASILHAPAPIITGSACLISSCPSCGGKWKA